MDEKKGDGVYTLIAADDGSLPVKTDKAKKAMLKQRKDFEMDSYYKFIRDYTYKTQFIPISFEEAKALRLYFRGKIGTNATSGNDIDDYKEEITHMNNLKTKIQSSINTLKDEMKDNDSDYQFFVRMSSRSPKDAGDKPLFRSKLLSLMRETFIINKKYDYNNLNERLIGLRECFSKILCVSTCNQMLELLSYSERCVSDLKRLIDHKHLLDKWDLYLVIREFKFIPICNEFRCFVNNSKLTAITQYFPHCYFKQLIHQNMDKIKINILQFFDKIILNKCNSLNIELSNSYILDLNVDIMNDKILIIELNPFSITTGSGFFDWTKDKQLLYGDNYDNTIHPEIRVRTEIDKHCDAVLNQWDQIFIEFDKSIKNKQNDDDDDDNDSCPCLLM